MSYGLLKKVHTTYLDSSEQPIRSLQNSKKFGKIRFNFSALLDYIFFLLFFRDEMRNTFNLLLISMIAFDSWYLLGSILENFRRNFGLGSQLHTILFPKFLYPAMSVAMSGSIFMTVAISLERYFAVHHPIGNKINTTYLISIC